MLDRACKHKESIKQFLVGRSIQSLTDNEWNKLETMVKLLKPCKESTDVLGGEKYVSSSIVLPHIAHLLHLNQPDDDEPAYVSRFKKFLIKDLETRRSAMTTNMFLKCSTALDPRHKRLKCIPTQERAAVWMHVTSLVKLQIRENSPAIEGTTAAPVAPKPKKSRFAYESSDDSGSDAETGLNYSTNAQDEAVRIVQLYKSFPAVEHDVNPLDWWKINQHAFPFLTAIARQYLCCPGTSVPSERLFSCAGNIISKRRASLLPENANTLLCLSNWLKSD